MTSLRLLSSLCIASLALAVAAPAPADTSSAAAAPLSAFPRERIAVETRASFRRSLFDAWRADTDEAREQGLMFVRDDQMRDDQAMIFVYDPPEFVSMWMKNTLLSLDMLFVDADGCIVKVKEHATPQSLSTISSSGPVMLVVELKAGTAVRHGIARGDRVLRLDTSWPRTQATCRTSD